MADWAKMRKSVEAGALDAERILQRAEEGRVRKSAYRHHNGRRHGFLATQLSWGAKRRGARG